MPTFNEPVNLEDLGYKYNKDKNSYTKIDIDGGKIEYMPSVKRLNYEIYTGDFNYKVYYNYETNIITYIVLRGKSKIVFNNSYDVKKNKIILKENQKNDNIEKIQYLLDIYNNITKSL